MPFSQGSRAGLSYVPEVTYGVTPASPALIQLPFKSHSLSLTKERVTGGDILPDRMVRHDRHGNRAVAGDITVDLRKGDYDALLESAMMGTFATNVLTVGTTLKSFSIEDAANDISQFRLFTGCAVSTMAISIKPNAMVEATFGVVGKNLTQAGTSVDPVKTAASNNQPFDAYSGQFRIADAGGTPVATPIVTSFDFTVTNSLAPTYVIGSNNTPQLEYGMAQVEGNITAYFEDALLLNRFLNETETLLEIFVDDPTGLSEYGFRFPKVKINAADVPVEGPTSRLITLPFVALYDTTLNTSLRITRAT